MICFKILKIAKILLSNVDYFKLPQDLLKDTYQKFKKYCGNFIDNNLPHIVIVLTQDELKKYCKNYLYDIDINKANDIQIVFLNPLNRKKIFIGDKKQITNKMSRSIDILTTNLAIKGLTSNNGQTIVIQNSKRFNMQSLLQHQLIHAIRMMFDLTNKSNKYENNFYKQIIRYFLTDKQFPSLITDLCYEVKTLQEFKKMINVVNKIYQLNIEVLYSITEKMQYGQQLLFLSVLKNIKSTNTIKL